MIKVLICDDDNTVVSNIELLISKWSAIHNIMIDITKQNSGDFAFCNDNIRFDIAFIDVEMPGINGLKLSEKLKEINPDTLILIITSYQNYLDSAMKIKVFRYVSKPIDPKRLISNFEDAVLEYRNSSKTIIIDNSTAVYTVRTKDILYIESLKYGSRIVTKYECIETGKKAMLWAEVINQPDIFVNSHTSFIVNLQNVIDFNKEDVTLRKNDSETVKVYMSGRRYSKFKKSFMLFAGDRQ